MTRQADGLQYGSRASYGTALSGCDTNAARFTSAADMQAWLTGGTTDMSAAEVQEIKDYVDARLDAESAQMQTWIASKLDGTIGRVVDDLALDTASATATADVKKTVSDTAAGVLAAISTLSGKLTDLTDAVSQIQTASGGGPATITLTGTSTPSAP